MAFELQGNGARHDRGDDVVVNGFDIAVVVTLRCNLRIGAQSASSVNATVCAVGVEHIVRSVSIAFACLCDACPSCGHLEMGVGHVVGGNIDARRAVEHDAGTLMVSLKSTT